jgi:undecaprenyl phosphate N,N'-diacetylbacillosamine 1-phosphate transferase
MNEAYKSILKPLFNYFLALVLLLILSPVLLIVSIILFYSNNGKPFFTPWLPGKNEKLFRIIKFKTMNDKKDSDGNLLSDSERLTNVGHFMRKTSFDELPQLFNILKGDMAFKDPRPFT